MPTSYEALREENIRRYGTDIARFGKRVPSDLYDDRTHFIYELLQNAEDALRRKEDRAGIARAVQFKLDPNGLTFSHYGAAFNEKDVRGICGIGESSKEGELTAIGRFGIGFKAVYAFTDLPEVHSGDEHFAIESFVWPRAIESRRSNLGETVFVLPFRRQDTGAFEEIAARLQSLGAAVLLFLRHVEEITWHITGGSAGAYLRQEEQLAEHARRVTLVGQKAGDDLEDQQWIVFGTEVNNAAGDAVGQAEIAFRTHKNSQTGKEDIKALSTTPLFVFFPTALKTELGFVVQGPYRTTPSRENVPKADAWNKQLVDITARLVCDSLVKLKELNLLTIEALHSMPIDAKKLEATPGLEVASMFVPIFDAVKETLRSQALLPTFGGGHASGDLARLARTEGLRSLINPSQLGELLGLNRDIVWLSEEITQNRTPQLRSYLMSEIGVAEIDTDVLIPRFTAAFLSKQSDAWMTSLYQFLLGQPSLWRVGGFRLSPIVRLENGSQVTPFNLTGEPNAFLPGPGKETTSFPTAKRSICVSPNALRFLEELGLSAPDPVDDVVKNVLPRYRDQNANAINNQTYEEDIAKIVNSFGTDSTKQREKLVSSLKLTPFILAVDAGSDETKFVLPGHAYLSTERMKKVFGGVKGVWLASDKLRGEAIRNVLQAAGVMDVIRTIPTADTLSYKQREQLRIKQGNNIETWERITDHDCPELQSRLSSLPIQDDEARRVTSIELWRLLRDTLRGRRDNYFHAEYVWGYGQRRWLCQFPAQWVRRLQDAEWIPDTEGKLRAPKDICFSNVDTELAQEPNGFLIDVLGFRSEAIKELAEQEGIELEALSLLKKHGLTADRLRELLGEKEGGASQPDGSPADAIGALLGGQIETAPPPVGATTEDEFATGSAVPSGRAKDNESSGVVAGPNEKGTPGSKFIGYSGVYQHQPSSEAGSSNQENLDLERKAIRYILSKEPHLHRLGHNQPGYDLVERDSNGNDVRFIEVKALRGPWSGRPATLSAEQLRAAHQHGSKFWLYVVENAGNEAIRIIKIADPVGKASYYTFDAGWQESAEK